MPEMLQQQDRKEVIVLGGDGFCGWASSLYLADQGHHVTIVDNFSRREIDEQLGVESLTPIRSMEERLDTWKKVAGEDKAIDFIKLDAAEDYDGLVDLFRSVQPDTVLHMAEQRSAPYSMMSAEAARYTVRNNSATTTNLLIAQHFNKEHYDAAIGHIGTMGHYGYGDAGSAPIPEGYETVFVPGQGGELVEKKIPYPGKAGSFYHETKSVDQEWFQFAHRLDGLRVTDLHQGIVWGTQTEQTILDPALVNRFDYDGVYGTVLNRFIMQAAMGHKLTVHGSGEQTRAFINIKDTVRCIGLAVLNPPKHGEMPHIFNQVTETHRLIDLAEMVIKHFPGAEIEHEDNPRQERASNELVVSHRELPRLGLTDPTLVGDEIVDEIYDIALANIERAKKDKILATVKWQPSPSAAQ